MSLLYVPCHNCHQILSISSMGLSITDYITYVTSVCVTILCQLSLWLSVLETVRHCSVCVCSFWLFVIETATVVCVTIL